MTVTISSFLHPLQEFDMMSVNKSGYSQCGLRRMTTGGVYHQIRPAAPFHPFPAHAADKPLHVIVVHGGPLPYFLLHPLSEPEGMGIHEHYQPILLQQIKFLFCHGIISTDSN